MKSLFKVVLLSIFLCFSIQAKDSSSGCGPGWFLFKKNSLVSSALRATTNGVLFPFVTLGMTFGTSNCTKHSLVKTEKKTIHFVTHNVFEIKSEAARGSGDFLKSYAKTIGCQSDVYEYFSSKLQDQYENIFKEKSTNEDIIVETYKVILSDKRLTNSCSLS